MPQSLGSASSSRRSTSTVCICLGPLAAAHHDSANRIDVEGTKAVAAVLPSMTRLRHVFMCGTTSRDPSARSPFAYGADRYLLRTRGSKGARGLAARLPAPAGAVPHLYVSTEASPATISCFRYKANNLGDDGTAELARVIGGCKQLSSLSISGTSAGAPAPVFSHSLQAMTLETRAQTRWPMLFVAASTLSP